MKKNILLFLNLALFLCFQVYAQSPSSKTFVNPVIPGDHPDPTLTQIGEYFYSSGSSFNPTPKIYRSTDLVHWEVIAQPVDASWGQYGDQPGGGAWGGHTVYHNGKYWHFFGRGGGAMYFVTASSPTAAWSDPVQLQRFGNLPPFGVDNSIFIDEDTGRWYLLTKAGHENNHIVELGEDGQPTGNFLDITWLNPNSENNPYGWAEGPVMWKHDGTYYYSFAEHLVGQQYVMRSNILTDNEADWEVMNGSMFQGSRGTFDRPNHISPAITLEDGTSWVIGHSYHNSNNWQAQGRQGLLIEVKYEDGWPIMQYPPTGETEAPDLPNSDDISWMVPKSDMFNAATLNPQWSVLGYTPDNRISLSERAGWVYLEPYNDYTTLIQNDGEHQYSAITRVDFEADSDADQAGLWIVNGPENLFVKVYSSADNTGDDVLGISFDDIVYEVENTLGSVVWLKLIRNDHFVSGYYGDDGSNWIQIGDAINAIEIGRHQNDFNNFTGNQQGIFVEGKAAFFDSYIYRDAYTDIMARNPANFSGVRPSDSGSYLGSISNGDWAMYAGLQFGTSMPSSGVDYQKAARQVTITAASNGHNGTAEVWLGDIETGEKIADVQIEDSGGNTSFDTFNAATSREVTGSHDVYLRFDGAEGVSELFRIQSLTFSTEVTTSNEETSDRTLPNSIRLSQNYPNPFNPGTEIRFQLPEATDVRLNVFDMLGRKVATLVDSRMAAGEHRVSFDASNLSSGIYIYRLRVFRSSGGAGQAGGEVQTRKMTVIK
ncbi:family 43 glycosylhydrolase [Rhodohalobacter sp. 8-1]|uniref:family 43 glycosylhydrolase n=1 Tax=Rhodohalobacter sp. 8-1 TaxID=3131972 RepID=UPI0030EBA09B